MTMVLISPHAATGWGGPLGSGASSEVGGRRRADGAGRGAPARLAPRRPPQRLRRPPPRQLQREGPPLATGTRAHVPRCAANRTRLPLAWERRLQFQFFVWHVLGPQRTGRGSPASVAARLDVNRLGNHDLPRPSSSRVGGSNRRTRAIMRSPSYLSALRGNISQRRSAPVLCIELRGS